MVSTQLFFVVLGSGTHTCIGKGSPAGINTGKREETCRKTAWAQPSPRYTSALARVHSAEFKLAITHGGRNMGTPLVVVIPVGPKILCVEGEQVEGPEAQYTHWGALPQP